LLLLHGEELICAEYIPSKLYEYLWMQRPIVALVHGNPQMEDMLRIQGHTVISSAAIGLTGSDVSVALASKLRILFEKWSVNGLPDGATQSTYSTESAASNMLCWVGCR
jgi:hypothetical protein